MDRWQIYEPIGLLDSVGHNLVVLCDGILFIVIRFFWIFKVARKVDGRQPSLSPGSIAFVTRNRYFFYTRDAMQHA